MRKDVIITVNNLVKNYDDFESVKGISFDVCEQELFGYLGLNGAGNNKFLKLWKPYGTKPAVKLLLAETQLIKTLKT